MRYIFPLLFFALIGYFILHAETWVITALLAVTVYTVVILADAFLFKGEIFTNADEPLIISALMQLLILAAIPFVEIDITLSLATAVAFFAGVFNMLGFWLYFKAVNVDQDAVVITVMMNLLIASVPLMAFYMIGERLGGLQYLGIGSIFLGAMVASYQKAKANLKIILLMLGSVLLLSFSMVLMKEAFTLLSETSSASAYWSGMIIRALGCGAIGLIFSVGLVKSSSKRRRLAALVASYWLIFLVAEMLEIGADMLTGLAMLDGNVSVVAAMDGLMGIIGATLCILLVYVSSCLNIKGRFLQLAISIRDQQLEHYQLKIIGMALITIGTYLTI